MESLSSSHSSSTLEAATRRRALNNFSKIVTSFRNRAASAGLYDESHGFLMPHERRRAAGAYSYEFPDLGSASYSTTSSKHWRRGRRLHRKRDRHNHNHLHQFPWNQALAQDESSPISAPTDRHSSARTGSLPVSHMPFNPTNDEMLMAIGSMVVEHGAEASSPESVPLPESPGDSAELSMPEDPPSGASNGGYSSCCDGRTCVGGEEYAERADLLALRAEVRSTLLEMRQLQERNYMLLNSSLQENFQATGALEARLEKYASRGNMQKTTCSGPGRASCVLMWTLLDGISVVLLWLITLLITKPYDVLKRTIASKVDRRSSVDLHDPNNSKDFWESRKSWRLSNPAEFSAELSALKASRVSWRPKGDL